MVRMPPDDGEFVLELPATALATPVARATAAAAAMVHDLAVDDVTDLRLAVGQACSILLPLAAPDTTMRCTVRVRPADVDATVQITNGATVAGPLPNSLDMRILRSLTTHLDRAIEPGERGTTRTVLRLLLARTMVP